jgi:hypothetical protein
VCKLSVVVLPLYEANIGVVYGLVTNSLPVKRKTVNLQVDERRSVCAYDSYWKKREIACVGIYSTQTYFSGASEYISEGSAINYHRSDSDVKMVLVVHIKNQKYELQHGHLQLRHHHQLQGVGGQSRW